MRECMRGCGRRALANQICCSEYDCYDNPPACLILGCGNATGLRLSYICVVHRRLYNASGGNFDRWAAGLKPIEDTHAAQRRCSLKGSDVEAEIAGW